MKAVVMETRDKEAAILLKDGTFRVVKGKYTVGETIDYREKIRALPRKWMSIAAAAVLMLGTGGGFWYDANYVAYAEISLDVNPSIIYTINKQSRVLEVKAVNDEANDAVIALNKEGIRFMPVDEAIEKTMTIFENEGYLSTADEDYVLLNVSADDSRMQDGLATAVETGMGHVMESNPTMEFRIDLSDRETARRASENHMSTGRYAIWEQEGGDRKPEEFAEMPIREVMGKPEEDEPAMQETKEQPGAGSPTEPVDAIKDESVPVPSGNGIQGAPTTGNVPEMQAPDDKTNAESRQEQKAPIPPENRDDQSLQLSQNSPEQASEQSVQPDQQEQGMTPLAQQEQGMNPPTQQEGLQTKQDGLENKGKETNPSAIPVDQGPKGSNISQPRPEGINNEQMSGKPGGQPSR